MNQVLIELSIFRAALRAVAYKRGVYLVIQ
jgi:hypothetical protein